MKFNFYLANIINIKMVLSEERLILTRSKGVVGVENAYKKVFACNMEYYGLDLLGFE